ncbi:MAG: hypothetical protein ACKVZH_01705 [Blastocatellia bacterium]
MAQSQIEFQARSQRGKEQFVTAGFFTAKAQRLAKAAQSFGTISLCFLGVLWASAVNKLPQLGCQVETKSFKVETKHDNSMAKSDP